MKVESGYLYLMYMEKCKDKELYKIGKTDNIERRIIEHQRNYPESKLIISVISPNYHNIENKIIEISNKNFKCIKGREFFKASCKSVVDLFNTAIETNTTENVSLKCNYCKKEFSYQKTLLNHQKTAKYCIKIQKDLKENGNNPDLINIKNFNCEYCDKIFTSKNNLNKHTLICANRFGFIINKKDNEIKELQDKILYLEQQIKTVKIETELDFYKKNSDKNQYTINEIIKNSF